MATLLVCLVCFCAVISASNLPNYWVRQSYKVQGVLKCGDLPAPNVWVELIDKDHGHDFDDILDEILTDARGNFRLSGDIYELDYMEPQLRIKHNCDTVEQSCKRVWLLNLPHKYISPTKIPEKTLDVGILNLEAVLSNE